MATPGSVPEGEESRPVGEMLPLGEAAARYGKSPGMLYKLFLRGHVRGERRAHNLVLLDCASIEAWFPPPGWDWLGKARRRYGVSRGQALRVVHEGHVRARRSGQRWQVEISSFLESVMFTRGAVPGWIPAIAGAKRLGLTIYTIRQYVRRGRLRAQKMGGRLYVEQAGVEAMLASRRIPAR